MRLFLFPTLILFSISIKAQVKFNGNFERLDAKGNPVGWDLTFDHANTYDVKLDSLVKKQGKYSVSISSGDSKGWSSAINFPIRQSFHGKTLILVGNIKTENVTGGWAGVWMRVDGSDKQVLAFDNMQKNGITGTNDWKEYVVQLPYDDENAATINCGALLVGKGKIWVDSLRLYLDDNPIDKAPTKAPPSYGAEKDSAFAKGSGIDTIICNSQTNRYLVLLGELWGFLKYEHPAIAVGNYNWDVELFRILPALLKCKTDRQAAELMEKWVDGLGKPAPCPDCKPVGQLKDVAFKPDYGSLFTNKIFSKTLTAKLQYILANSNNQKNYYAELQGGINAAFRHEKGYAKMLYPDAGYRLLALYRYWNIIQYFCPNRNLIPGGWDDKLDIFIPKVIEASNKTEYVKTMVKLIASIHDGHGFIRSSVYDSLPGKYRVPFQARFIEGKLVVTNYYKDTLAVKSKFKIGDVIISINGVPVTSLVKKYLPLSSASNKGAALRDMPGAWLLRSKNQQFNFKLMRNDHLLSVRCKAVSIASVDFYAMDWDTRNSGTSYKLLNKNTGYLFAAKYHITELDSIKKKFKNTKGIIIDLRCYPSDDLVFSLGNYLKPDSTVFVKFAYGSVTHPGLFFTMAEKNGISTKDYYKGKVVVIVNSKTQSNAEFVTMAFQSGPNTTVIGSTTAGADGNISEIPLPGDLTTWMSGLGVYYPDGTNTQQKGVKIDYTIAPTIKEIKAGRDELLEKAEQLVSGGK